MRRTIKGIAMMNRRDFCCTAAGLISGLVTPPLAISVSRAQGRIPFCRFSLEDGWSADGKMEWITRQATRNDRSGVPQVIREIVRVLKFREPIEVYIAKQENNAFATVAQGRKLIVADVEFLESLNRYAGTEWGAIQVIAHEVGHHIAGFIQDRPRGELNADYWSGQALQRLGADKDAATSAILVFGTDVDTQTHPNKHRRAEVIARGWNDSYRGKVDYSFCEACR
jgi:hypothetical protein